MSVAKGASQLLRKTERLDASAKRVEE